MPSTLSPSSRHQNVSISPSSRPRRNTRDTISRPVSRPYNPSTTRSMNVIVNLDEILTQRSQVSMSQYNGSGDESGSNSIKRLHSTAVVRLTERSVTPPSSRGGRYSPEQQYLVNNGGGGDNRIERRHSSAVPIGRSDSISSSGSSYDGVLTNRRPASRKSIITSMTHATPMYPQEADDSSETSESYQSSGFFSCMRCFKSSHATNHSSENRSSIS